MTAPSHTFIVSGKAYAPPPGLCLTNFHDPAVETFDGRERGDRAVTEFIIHESVTRSRETTVAVLRERGLGVHFIIDADGSVTQHGDLQTARLAHAGGHNGPSIGVELVTPYYPARREPGDPWRRVIDAPWAHQGEYAVPAFEQVEALALLTRWLLSERCPLGIPADWIGLESRKFRMARVPGAEDRRPGVYAHTYFHHADGAFPTLYAWMRVAGGLAPSRAYEEAIRRVTDVQRQVNVSDLLREVAA